MTLQGVRLGAGVLVLIAAGLLLYKRRPVAESLRRFFFEPSPPTNLALLRVAVFGGLTIVSLQTSAVWWASVPAELRFMPPGWRWLHGVLPISGALVSGAQQVVVIASVCAALGALTRVTAPIAAVLSVYVLGVPSFFGKVLHMDHALVMMALVIAASPCGDALSVDGLWRQKRGGAVPGPSTAYTLPIRLSWLLLGSIYLFPGLWKLWNNGDLWLNGQRLYWELMDEWGQRKNFDPPLRIDQQPTLLKLLGASTLIFEIGIFFAIFNRYTRIAAALAAVAFHVGVRLFLGIKYYAYVPLVLLIDFPTFGAYKAALPQARSMLASAIVGCTLLALQAFVGLAQIDTWPVALHPKFDERTGAKTTASNNMIALSKDGGDEQDVGRALVGVGAMNGFTRLFLNVDRDVARGIPRQARTRALVTVMRDAGLDLDAGDIITGDIITVYATRWKVYPLGERSGFRRSLKRRYRVAEDDSLEVISK
jgi:hypothetical protein